jgi:glycosyltransferase involved in cell wall biosynthesis
MKTNKKILIFGPIGDFGGRDVEVNIIARSLLPEYDVRIFSTIYITEKSFAVQNLSGISFSSLKQKLYHGNLLIRMFSYIKFLQNRKENKPYDYIKNRLSNPLFDFRVKELKVIESEIRNADAVIGCVQLSSQYLPEAVEISKNYNIPFIVRTTGTIREIHPQQFDFLRKVTHFIYHSEANAKNFNRQIALPYTVIDQCALSENSLLKLPIHQNEKVVFGYIGRLSWEKAILQMIDFFKDHPQFKLVVAGDGAQKQEMLAMISGKKHIEYLGHIDTEQISEFFQKIDCLVIPSLEEAGPLVGLEAMAAAKPIISTRVGAMMERLAGTKNDFWFDIHASETLKTALENFQELTQEERLGISAELREKYKASYQATSIENQYLQLLKKTVG